MFLQKLKGRNPGLISAAAQLHRSGAITPTTYVIDLDAIEHNAGIIKKKARETGLKLYPMTKQLGRNPLAAQIMVSGTSGAVAVDIEGVKSLVKSDVRVGHVGHLLQTPVSDIPFVLEKAKPEVITVFTVEKAAQISEHAKKMNGRQDLLLRIAGEKCFFYPMQEGGFTLDELPDAVEKISGLEGVRIAGVTTFPVLVFDPKTKGAATTPNFGLMMRGADILSQKGCSVDQINAPGTTSTCVMDLLKERGATHVEPGHGFAGMTPLHAFENLPEIPAVVWVTEISHSYRGSLYAYGYGFGPDTLACGDYDKRGFVGPSPDTVMDRTVRVEDFYPAMDYIIKLEGRDDVSVGDTVVFGFRQQISFSTAKVAVLRGVQSGNPELAGLFDRTGNSLEW